MAKVRRQWGGEQWVGPFPWPDGEPPGYWDPGWQYCHSYWVGLIHPLEHWGTKLTIPEHTLIVMEDAYTGMQVTNCGMAIGLPANKYTLADCEAWALAAAARLERYPERILSVCPGCQLGGHRYMPF